MEGIKAEKAAPEKYKKAYVCSEAILLSLKEEGILNFHDDVVRAATGFGAGVGWAKKMCGALSGGIMAIGLKYGRNDLEGSRRPAWDRSFELVKRVERQYGTVQCADLIKNFDDLADPVRINHCSKIIGFVTAETKDILKHTEDGAFSAPERDSYYQRREKRVFKKV